MGKVVMPKNSAIEEEILAALKIYYDENDWLKNDVFTQRLKKVIGDGQYHSSYTKKVQMTSYFGFTEWQDFSKNTSPRRITERGKRFYTAWNNEKRTEMDEEILASIETVVFGRNNCGCSDSDSDIDIPPLFIRTLLKVGYLTYTEFAYLLWNMEDCAVNFTDAVRKLLEVRNGGTIELVEEAKKYTDAKPIAMLIRWGFLEEDGKIGNSTKIVISNRVLTKYRKRLEHLKIYNIDKFPDDENECNDDFEEENKRLFRLWLEVQVKSETDSDAGNPYSKASIEQYVSNVANTPLQRVEGKSLFYTTDIAEVEATVNILNCSEKKNNTQRSAVKKYLQYLYENQSESVYVDVLEHSLFGIHIKQENDALSEENPHICIGWSVLGDLSDIESREQLSNIYDEKIEKNSRGKGQDVGQVWRFLHDMNIGDYVIFAEPSVFHIGQVESDYYYDDSENPNQSTDYTNNRKVKWLKKNISRSELSDSMHNSLKTAMSVWTLNDYKSAVVDLLRGTYVKDGAVDMEDEYKELVFNTKIQIDAERNRIIFGAPGTGKSYGLKKDCEDLMKDKNGMYERVTFHPDYSYSQFVGTYKPVMDTDGKSIKYDFVPGPFMRVYVEALRSGRTNDPQPHLLLIEEINRAKVAAVFGDVFQLLDRDEDGVSEYEIQASEDIRKYLAKELGGNPANYQRIKIPNNMFIWSTMNSADQGVFPMDTAFKRRWNFEYLGINENEEEIVGIGKIMLAGCDEPVEWNVLRRAINDKMSTDQFKINEDKLMGPFFLSKKILASNDEGMIIDPETFIRSFKSKVIMYLYEDAVKQGKHRFFDGCDNSKYSSVCDAFDEIGMGIFGQNFKENFYDKQKDEV